MTEMADLFGTLVVVALVIFAISYLFSNEGRNKKLVKKAKGKPNEPIEFGLRNIVFPTLSGFPLYFLTCIFKWRITKGLKDAIIKSGLRHSNCFILRESSISDSPTFLPQVLPSTKQKEIEAPDIEGLLKKQTSQKGFHFLTIGELVEAYRNGSTTPLQVTENALEAIRNSEKLEPKLKAFVQFNKADALLMAQESTKRYTEKKPLSVIDGVPVGIKEEFEVLGLLEQSSDNEKFRSAPRIPPSGQPALLRIPDATASQMYFQCNLKAGYHHRCGTAFLGEELDDRDCNLVRKLRELGAVILGMTNMHELGLGTIGDNPNSLHGTSRNPYNLNHNTGGSSSGSASAVASGICPVTIGKDGGGSIRIPASICGVVGIKATFGRITGHAHKSYGSATVSHAGPICNNVRDTAIMYALLSGRDVDYCPGWVQPDHATLEGFENTNLSDLTVGVDWTFAEFADEEVVDHFKKGVQYVKNQGATVVSVQIPELEECRVAHLITIGTELTLSITNGFPDNAPELNADSVLLSKTAETFTSLDYVLAQKQRTRSIEFMKSIFEKVDCILTPAAACVAPMIPSGSLKYGRSDPCLTGLLMRYSVLGNMTGIPGVVVPVGYTDLDLPIGVQVMAAWWEEHVALRVAHALEGLVTKKKPEVYFDILSPGKNI